MQKKLQNLNCTAVVFVRFVIVVEKPMKIENSRKNHVNSLENMIVSVQKKANWIQFTFFCYSFNNVLVN